jgi:hypothetical protein
MMRLKWGCAFVALAMRECCASFGALQFDALQNRTIRHLQGRQQSGRLTFLRIQRHRSIRAPLKFSRLLKILKKKLAYSYRVWRMYM